MCCHYRTFRILKLSITDWFRSKGVSADWGTDPVCVARGLTTLSEAPDSGKNGQPESRSDCHARGSHPIWFMQSGIAGIRSGAPWFEKVFVSPQPGALKSLKAKHPHPKGWIEVDLKFDGETAKGTVNTPVPGKFFYGKTAQALLPGAERQLPLMVR